MSELHQLSEAVKYMKDKLDEIAEAITGSPTDTNKPGIIIRLDRLERSYTKHRRTLAIFVSGMIAVVGTTITALLLRFI